MRRMSPISRLTPAVFFLLAITAPAPVLSAQAPPDGPGPNHGRRAAVAIVPLDSDHPDAGGQGHRRA